MVCDWNLIPHAKNALPGIPYDADEWLTDSVRITARNDRLWPPLRIVDGALQEGLLLNEMVVDEQLRSGPQGHWCVFGAVGFGIAANASDDQDETKR